ncbi:hypothetical protein ABZ543_32145 [Streptomyces roseifaciens]
MSTPRTPQDDTDKAARSLALVKWAMLLAFGVVVAGLTVFTVLVLADAARPDQALRLTVKITGSLLIVGATAATALRIRSDREGRKRLRRALKSML